MDAYINAQLIGDCLQMGVVGFVFGVVLPFGFRLVGYVVDSVMLFVKG